MAVKKRIALLGGSFDPVHLAHIQLAEQALLDLSLDELQLLPAANPWQREPLMATPKQRLSMLQLATAHNPKLRINTTEIERGGPTYTVDTINALPSSADYFWVLGADQLQNLCSWKDWERIVQGVNLAVAARPGNSLEALPPTLVAALQQSQRQLHYLNFTPTTLSATDIRKRLAQQKSTEGLLNPAVARYIQDNRLYQSSTTTH